MFLEISQNSQAEPCNFIIKKETLAQVFFYEFYEISKNSSSTKHLWWVLLEGEALIFWDLIISYIFPQNFIETHQVIQNM